MSSKNLLIFKILGFLFLIVNTLVLMNIIGLLFMLSGRMLLHEFSVWQLILVPVFSIIGIILSLSIMGKSCRYRITKAAIVIALLIINILILWITG